MRRAALAAATVLVIVASGIAGIEATKSALAPYGASPRTSVSTPVSIVETATAISNGSATRTFYQNGTSTFAAASSLLVIPFTFGSYTVTQVLSADLAVRVGMPKGITPMLNVTQPGGPVKYLANGTVPYLFDVAPSITGGVVDVRAKAAFLPNGTTPSIGTYGLWFNWTETVRYENTSKPIWTLTNGSKENLSVPVTIANGGPTWAIQDVLFVVPYAVQAYPNITTLNVSTSAGYVYHGVYTNLTTYTTSPGNGFLNAYLPYVAANRTLRISYLLVGVTNGVNIPIPILILGPATRLASGFYEASASWVNIYALPYAGTFYIDSNQSITFNIVPSSLNVTQNGHVIRNNTFALAGNQIVILAGSVTVGGGRPVLFDLKFQLYAVPAQVGLCASCTIGNSSVPWWVVSALFMAVMLGIAGVLFVEHRGVLIRKGRYARPSQATSVGFWLALVLFAVATIVTFVSFLPGF